MKGTQMREIITKIRNSIKEIITTIIEIVAVAAIAIGAGINWGFGTGLIVAGVLTLIMSYLLSLEVTE